MNKFILFLTASIFVAISFLAHAEREAIVELAEFTESYLESLRPQMLAYRRFGPPYYRPNMNYPSVKPAFPYKLLEPHSIPINRSALPQNADETGWLTVPIDEKNVYYLSEFHIRDVNGFSIEGLISDLEQTYSAINKRTWKVSGADRQALAKAKVHIALFPSESFKLKFHPGTYLLKNERGARNGAKLNGTRKNIPWQADYDRVSEEDHSQLVGVFKGTFDNLDCPKNYCLPGLTVNTQEVDKPHQNMATVAIDSHGVAQVASYEKINTSDIVSLRQNEFMVLEDGKVMTEGAYPKGWNRYGDIIMRTYLITSQDNRYFGYVWTMFTPPSFLAHVLQKIGIQNMMLIDIHPAVGAAFAKPMTLSQNQHTPFFSKNGSFPFIPMETEVISSAEAVVGARIRGAPMQWPYSWAKTGSATDFFSVLRRKE